MLTWILRLKGNFLHASLLTGLWEYYQKTCVVALEGAAQNAAVVGAADYKFENEINLGVWSKKEVKLTDLCSPLVIETSTRITQPKRLTN